MIHVIATITVQPGRRAEFIDAFHRLMPDVLAEDGCIAYGPAVDIESGLDAQPPVRPDVVTVVEQWESLPHLKAHLTAPHMNTWRSANGPLIRSIELAVLEPA